MHGCAKVLLALSLLMMQALALASGDGPHDDFVSRAQPDVSLDAYDAGALGILLPTYPRVFLYPAWRAIVLNRQAAAPAAGAPAAPARGRLQAACCNSVYDWYPSMTDERWGPAKWLAVRGSVNPLPPRVEPTNTRDAPPPSEYSYRNCPDPAWFAAAATLQSLQARADATPGRLQAWVAAQDAVFEFCGYAEGTARYGRPAAPRPEVPVALPVGEPLLWRQWRDYQIAAANFYAGRFGAAESLFTAIGTQAGHPMQGLGAYLALRARLRDASLTVRWDEELRQLLKSPGSAAQKADAQKDLTTRRARWQEQKLAELQQQGQRILDQPALQAVHGDVRALLRNAAAQLTPQLRLARLADLLDKTEADPYADDTLGDWVHLANNLLDGGDTSLIPGLRQRHAWFDWMRAMQACEGTLVNDKSVSCAGEYPHALARWTELSKTAQPEAAAWLLAALVTASAPAPALVEAASRVPASAPEYLSLQYQLVRLQRGARQFAAARQRADQLLATPPASISALNLLRRERFALASGRDDAARFVLRRVTAQSNADTGQVKAAEPGPGAPTQLDADGLSWLNERLSTADLLKLAEAPDLIKPLGASLATAAWWRAELLGQTAQARAAAELSARLAPRLGPLAQRYLGTQDAHERRHLLVLASLTDFASPMVATGFPVAPVDPAPPRANATASAWCQIGPDPKAPPVTSPLREPNGPAPQAESAAAVAGEMAALQKIPPATSFIGAHVLQRLSRQPADPDLPWLLYVTVQSTKGGCIGPDNGVLSRRAWNELHTRYKNSEWTARTPYWYK